jgi:hypothetical protein
MVCRVEGCILHPAPCSLFSIPTLNKISSFYVSRTPRCPELVSVRTIFSQIETWTHDMNKAISSQFSLFRFLGSKPGEPSSQPIRLCNHNPSHFVSSAILQLNLCPQYAAFTGHLNYRKSRYSWFTIRGVQTSPRFRTRLSHFWPHLSKETHFACVP